MSIATPCPQRPDASRRCGRRVLLLALFVAPVAAPPLRAQEPASVTDSTAASLGAQTVTLVGVVRDTAGRSLSGAEVRAGARQFTISDADGRFVLEGVAPDTIQLLVRRIGYLPAEVVLEARAGLRVELAVKLVPSVTELGTITVNGVRMDTRLWTSGFYDRQKLGSGTFFTPEYLERHAGSVGSLLREAPSVTVVRDYYGRAVAMGPVLSLSAASCPLNVFLDGVLIRWADEAGLDGLMDHQDILAVEVYPRATQVPPAFGGYSAGSSSSGGSGRSSSQGESKVGADGGDCGALVIWTKPIGDATPGR